MGLITDITVSLIAADLHACIPRASQWVISKAAARLPSKMQERYEEEWLAHLNDCASGFSKLKHALGAVWASRSLYLQWEQERYDERLRARRILIRYGLVMTVTLRHVFWVTRYSIPRWVYISFGTYVYFPARKIMGADDDDAFIQDFTDCLSPDSKQKAQRIRKLSSISRSALIARRETRRRGRTANELALRPGGSY